MAKLALLVSVLLHVNLYFVTCTSINIGDEVRSRPHVDSAVHFLMLPDVTDQSTINGMVTSIQIYTGNTKQVQISIWRPESGENYRFIGKLDVTPTVVGYNNIDLTPAEYIPVETGDVLGMLWASAGVIEFDVASCANKVNYRFLTPPPALVADEVYTLAISSTTAPCRNYSVNAVIEEQCVVSTQRAIEQYEDHYRGSTIFVDYPFQCAGPVSGLQFYGERAGTFYLSAWRPNGSGDSWTLLGYIAITSVRQGDQTYAIPVDEQLVVEASDVFGIVYPRGSPSLISSKKIRKNSRNAMSSRFRQTRQTVDRLSVGDRQSALSTGKRIVPINAIIG